MDKLKVSRDVANALEFVKDNNSIEDILKMYRSGINENLWVHEAKHLKTLTFEELLTVLYVGYEVKKTPEEKIRDTYNTIVKYKKSAVMEREQWYYNGYMLAVKETLNELGIKIEGVTDK